MTKKLFVLVPLMFLVFTVKSQHLIGKTKVQVEKDMETLFPGFVPDHSSVNHVYKYLKYVDKIKEQTMLVFLSADDICTSTQLMSDYANLLDVKEALNKKYKPSGKDKWKYTVDGKKFTVKIKRGEWYFTVLTTKE
jgi:hypothetical protein